MCRRPVAMLHVFVLMAASVGMTAEPENTAGVQQLRRQMARLHWQQAVAARDVELDSIKATHHFLHAGKLWANVGSEQDVVDAMHAAGGTESLIERTIVHGSPIRAAVVSADEKLVFICSLESNKARVWSLETGELVRDLEHKEAVVGGVFHGNGQLLATRSYGGVYLWDLEQQQPIGSIDPNEGTSIHGPVTEIRFRTGSRQILIRNRGSVYLWQAGQPQLVAEFHHWANTMDLSSDGKLLMTAGRDQQVRGGGAAHIWDIESGRRLSSFPHPAPVAQALFLPHGRILTFAYDDAREPYSSTGRVWLPGKGEALVTLSGGHGANSLVTDKAARFALSTGTGNLLTRDAYLWSLEDGSKIATYAHEEKIGGALFARTFPASATFNNPGPEQELVVTYTPAGTIKIWSREDHRLLQVLRHPAGISGIVVSPSGEWLGIWDELGTAKIFAMPDNLARSPLLELRQVLRHADAIRGLTFLGDDRAVTWSDDGCLRVWNLRAGQPTQKLFCVTPNRIGRPPPVKPAGENCWWTSFNGAVGVWSSRNPKALKTWPREASIRGVAGNKDGKLLLTWSDDQVATLWADDSDKPVRRWPHEANVRGGTFLSGNSVAVTWAGPSLNVWDTAKDRPSRSLLMESDIVAVELLPNGRAVVGSQQGSMSVVSLLRDARSVSLDPVAGLTDLKLSADGLRVAAWDARKRIAVQPLDGKTRPRYFAVDAACDFELDADLKLVLQTNSSRRQAWMYSMESGELLKQFHQDGQVDRELFRFRIASPEKIVSWGNRPHSKRVRLRVWSVDGLSSPTIEYDVPGLPREFVALDDGIVMVRFGAEVQALSLQAHRVLRRFHQHRFGLNQMLFAADTLQMYTTNPRGDFWQWDFHRQQPQTIGQAIKKFEDRSGMTIDADRRYRMRTFRP